MKRLQIAWLMFAGAVAPFTAYAELPSYELSLRDGHFTPALLEVPAGQRFKIILKNIGQGPAEFESTPLRVEKVLSPGVTTFVVCLLYTSPSPRDQRGSRMPSSA